MKILLYYILQIVANAYFNVCCQPIPQIFSRFTGRTLFREHACHSQPWYWFSPAAQYITAIDAVHLIMSGASVHHISQPIVLSVRKKSSHMKCALRPCVAPKKPHRPGSLFAQIIDAKYYCIHNLNNTTKNCNKLNNSR